MGGGGVWGVGSKAGTHMYSGEQIVRFEIPVGYGEYPFQPKKGVALAGRIRRGGATWPEASKEGQGGLAVARVKDA